MKVLPASSVPLHKRFYALWNRLDLYPVPEPLPRTRLFWLAFSLVTLVFLLFSGYFILLLNSSADNLCYQCRRPGYYGSSHLEYCAWANLAPDDLQYDL